MRVSVWGAFKGTTDGTGKDRRRGAAGRRAVEMAGDIK
jgi:hypothetical protein